MAKLSQEIKDQLLANPKGTVAILAHRQSNAGNVNVMFGEVEEYVGDDNGTFQVFMDMAPKKTIKYAWQVMKPEIAETLYGIKDSTPETTEKYIQDPMANDMYVKVMQIESLEGDERDLLPNIKTGEIVLDKNGNPIYRTSKIFLHADKNHQHETVRLERPKPGTTFSTNTSAPFSVDSL